ncbi:MAG: hypothetical protein ACOX0B_02155 [Minisyncoccales bacterium]|jgi:hypothetical protein
MKIFYSVSFEKRFRAFRYKNKAKEGIKIFLNNLFDEKLNTHSIDYSNRIFLLFKKTKHQPISIL